MFYFHNRFYNKLTNSFVVGAISDVSRFSAPDSAKKRHPLRAVSAVCPSGYILKIQFDLQDSKGNEKKVESF